MSSVLPDSVCALWVLASSFAVPRMQGDTFCATPASCLWYDLSQEVICAEILEAGRFDYGELLNDYKQYNYSITVKHYCRVNELILLTNIFFQALVTSSGKYKLLIQICMCSSVHGSVRQDCKPRKKDKRHQGVSSTPENYKI